MAPLYQKNADVGRASRPPCRGAFLRYAQDRLCPHVGAERSRYDRAANGHSRFLAAKARKAIKPRMIVPKA